MLLWRRDWEHAPDTDQRRFGDWKNKVDFLSAIRGWSWARRRTLVTAWIELGMLEQIPCEAISHSDDQIQPSMTVSLRRSGRGDREWMSLDFVLSCHCWNGQEHMVGGAPTVIQVC